MYLNVNYQFEIKKRQALRPVCMFVKQTMFNRQTFFV